MSTGTESAASESPYAPPRAVVADVRNRGEPMDRPPQVGRAVKCLWTVFGIGVTVALVSLIKPPPGQPAAGVMLVMYLVIFLLSAWMYSAIGRGRNWARILFLVFSGLSVLSVPFMVFGLMRGPQAPLQGVVSLLNLGISFYACYLLLTAPAREWFRYMKE